MGNCCSKSDINDDRHDNFSGPGRVLGGGASAAAQPTHGLPASSVVFPTTPGRPLDAAPARNSQSPQTGAGVAASSPAQTTAAPTAVPRWPATSGENPREAAARAAELRLNAKNTGGSLAAQAQKNRSKTGNQLLNEVASENIAARELDRARQFQTYD